MSEAKLICFDLGRVFIRICEDWDHACRIAGVKRTSSFGRADAATSAAVAKLIGRYDTGGIDLEEFARQVAPLRGLRAQDVIDLQNAYLLGPYPGVDTLLDELADAGMQTACLSNTTDVHWQQMHDPKNPNYLPLEKLTYQFASFLIGASKPGEAIYEHVERTTGFEGSNIVFFDDAAPNIHAASARGWQAHLIAHDGDPIRQVRMSLARLKILPST